MIEYARVLAYPRPERPVMKNDHLKREAYSAVARERKRGGLQPEACAVHDCSHHGTTVAHHEDYALPLDVTWLCRLHHAWRHMGDLDEQFEIVWWELGEEERIIRSLSRALAREDVLS